MKSTRRAPLILIADDDDTGRVLMRATLEQAGFEVAEVTNGRDAVADFGRLLPDLVVLDVKMPVMNGFDACREIRAHSEGEKVPILFVTGLEDLASIERAFELGATDFLAKPLNWGTLPYRLHCMLRASRAFEELSQAWQHAEAAREAKAAFLASMSHELRTPMTVILGYLEQLAADGSIDQSRPHVREALERIERSGSHLMRMVSQALDMAQIEQGVLQLDLGTCRPDQIAAEVVATWRPEAQARGLELELLTDGCEAVVSDGRRIGEILSNLLHNAIKFTLAGSIRVRATVEVAESSEQRSSLLLTVEDTGVGIAGEDLGRIFEPFEQVGETVSREFRGAGLGLSIVRELSRLLQGQVEVESVQGRGSRFCVRLPVVLESRAERAERAELRRSVIGLKLDCRVIYAEDSPDNQRLISQILGRAGASVELVENGERCLARVLAEPDGFDVILMDMQMPAMDGYEAARRLRAADVDTPIVALTAHVMTGDREKCLSAGCNDYLPKPFDRARLLASVAHWAEKSRLQ